MFRELREELKKTVEKKRQKSKEYERDRRSVNITTENLSTLGHVIQYSYKY
jgi:hypothetical protein